MSATPVLVAMSGGVDSSVTAALLQQQGYDVTGVTLKLWGGESDTGCCSVSDVDDARRAADQLGIPHHVFNFGDEFDQHVVQPYVDAHSAGLTPNPCIECNRHLKFDKLLRRAKALGFDLVATGHHARVVETASGPRIGRGADDAKDQSYVLHMLNQQQLGQVMLPLGDMTKDQVRAIAADIDLRTATKPDSQDVCFISRTKGGRQRFLETRVELTPGTVVDGDGQQVGSVDALELVTAGQRKGLGVSGTGDPVYAVEVDMAQRQVVVGSKADLYTSTTPLADLHWVGEPVLTEVAVQTSAHGQVATAQVGDGSLEWADQHRRVAPGQSLVFYQMFDGVDVVVGSATAI